MCVCECVYVFVYIYVRVCVCVCGCVEIVKVKMGVGRWCCCVGERVYCLFVFVWVGLRAGKVCLEGVCDILDRYDWALSQLLV